MQGRNDRGGEQAQRDDQTGNGRRVKNSHQSVARSKFSAESLTRAATLAGAPVGRNRAAVQSCILRCAWIDISTPKPVSSDTADVPP